MGYTQKKPHIQIGAEHLHPKMTFNKASDAWLNVMDFPAKAGIQRIGFIHPRTMLDYRSRIRMLSKHFSAKRLCDITPADLREYQEKRVHGDYTPKDYKRRSHQKGLGAGAEIINKECALLIRFLRSSKAWGTEIVESYMQLQMEPSDIPRAMAAQEQKHFLAVAGSRPSWAVVYSFSLFSLRTTMGVGEMRGLHRRDIDLEQGIVTVRAGAAKNAYRIRTIPLDQDALQAAQELLDRAKKMGSYSPDHFIFPVRVNKSLYDPTRPMTATGITRQWRQVREAADLSWLRMYDLRHTAITRYAEAGTPIQVLMDMAGHVSQQMQRHYTHISMQAKRQASAMVSLNAAQLRTQPNKTNRTKTTSLPTAEADFGLQSFIKKMQRAGLAADVILSILADDGGEARA